MYLIAHLHTHGGSYLFTKHEKPTPLVQYKKLSILFLLTYFLKSGRSCNWPKAILGCAQPFEFGKGLNST